MSTKADRARWAEGIRKALQIDGVLVIDDAEWLLAELARLTAERDRLRMACDDLRAKWLGAEAKRHHDKTGSQP